MENGDVDGDDSSSSRETDSSLESETAIGDVDLLAYSSAVCPIYLPSVR